MTNSNSTGDTNFFSAHTNVFSPPPDNIKAGVPADIILTEFQTDFIDLIEGRSAGHMSRYEYVNGSMRLWQEFLKTSSETTESPYYVIKEEIEIIEKCAQDSAKLIKEDGVTESTIISWGPGTAFDEKEQTIIKNLQEAGIKIAKIILIDDSLVALNKSVKQAAKLVGEDKVESYQTDIFNPETAKLYEIEGTAIGMMFGLTAENVAGNYVAASPPLSVLKKQYEGLHGQLREGDHAIFVNDHNSDKKSLENMFSNRTEMARNMLRHNMGWSDLESIELTSIFGESSKILSQQFHFTEGRRFFLAGERAIKAGTELPFNNSVKLTQDQSKSVKESAGFDYPDDVRMHSGNRLGYHHVIAAIA